MASNKAGHDLKKLLRPWSIAGMALVILTLFGGLVEAGVVAPKFTTPGTGSEGNTYSNTIENFVLALVDNHRDTPGGWSEVKEARRWEHSASR